MMIPEKRFLNQIQQVLARLMQPLWLLDTEGTVLLPEENRSKINLPEFMEPGMPVAFEGKTFLMIGITPELILCADAQGAATHDCIVLAGAMAEGSEFVMFALDPTVIYTFSPTSPVGNYLKLAHAIS